MADILTDPCGNPIPISLPSTGIPLEVPSLSDLLSLLGVPNMPAIAEPATPCPVLLDSARAAGGV
jgi:hypothetical protein